MADALALQMRHWLEHNDPWTKLPRAAPSFDARRLNGFPYQDKSQTVA
jgi:hypothetical protein